MKRILAVLPFAILCFTALYLYANWSRIPDTFPVHWGGGGQPDRWTTRTVGHVYTPLIIGAVLASLLTVLSAVSKQAFAPLTTVVIGLSTIMSIIALWPIIGSSRWPVFVLASTIVGTVVTAIIFGPRQEGPPEDGRWILGVVYYNPANPALMVPKRFGFGWTFNMAHHAAWVFLAMLLSVPLLMFWLIR